MSYTPLAGNAVDLQFIGTYIAPAGDDVLLDFTPFVFIDALEPVDAQIIGLLGGNVQLTATLDDVNAAVNIAGYHFVTVSAAFDDIDAALHIHIGANVEEAATLDDCSCALEAIWSAGVWRGVSLFKTGAHAQIIINQHVNRESSSGFAQPDKKRPQRSGLWETAQPLTAESNPAWLQVPTRHLEKHTGWTYVTPKTTARQFEYISAPPKPLQRLPAWQTATPYVIERRLTSNAPPRKQRNEGYKWTLSTPRSLAVDFYYGLAAQVFKKAVWIVWEQGTPHNWEWNWPYPPIPPIPPYLPNPNLVFYQHHLDYPGGAILEFNRPCWAWPLGNPNTRYHGGTLILNHTVIVKTLPGLVNIPAQSVSLQFDSDSWAWGVSITLKKPESMALLERHNGEPQQVSIQIDGFYITAIIEAWSQRLSFGETVYTATGRSPLALFAQPYAPIRSYLATAQQTAAQLIDHELLNTGWSAEYHSTLTQLVTVDWLIPGGTWSYQNKSPIDAIVQIAHAIGARAYSDRTADLIHIVPRYPVNPWDWATETPDNTIYTSLARSISSQLAPQPDYNHVIVSGQSQGVLISATRTGTAGDKSMPMVTDSLITTVGAGRERARNLLANTGNQARVTIELPMNDITGLLEPGQLVEVESAPNWRGLVTGINVNATLAEINQQIEIERHYP